jgi:hypothetical protein
LIVVAFTVSGDRQEYLRRSLDSWVRVRGIDAATLLFMVEPSRAFPLAEFTRWAEENIPCPVKVVANPVQLQCLANTRAAFSGAFGLGASFAVLAEEDIVVSSDVLEYLAWAEEEYRADADVVMVCAHVKESQGAKPWQVTRAPWFSPLICGTWHDRWEDFVLPGWGGLPDNGRGVSADQAWDVHLRGRVRQAGKSCLFPALSRALHIGEYSTWLSLRLSSAMLRGSESTCFSPDYEKQPYREVGFNDIPRLIV